MNDYEELLARLDREASRYRFIGTTGEVLLRDAAAAIREYDSQIGQLEISRQATLWEKELHKDTKAQLEEMTGYRNLNNEELGRVTVKANSLKEQLAALEARRKADVRKCEEITRKMFSTVAGAELIRATFPEDFK